MGMRERKQKAGDRRQEEASRWLLARRHGQSHGLAMPDASLVAAPGIVHAALHSPGQPLDPGTRGFCEHRFGYDFSRVRIHADVRASDSARAANALAYTVGQDVVFGAGQFPPVPPKRSGCSHTNWRTLCSRGAGR
jgi:hypothetical protein